MQERDRVNNRLLPLLNSIAGALRGSRPVTGHYHDVGGPSSLHSALRVKHGWRRQLTATGEREQYVAEMRDTAALEPDPRARLALFLRDFARRRFDSRETLESLTLLEDTTDAAKRGGRYLAAFSGGTRMIWTVALTSDGSVSFDGTKAPA